MLPQNELGKTIIFFGLAIIVGGLIIMFLPRGALEQFWRLPGNFRLQGKDYQVYFPLTASLLASLLLSLLLYLINRK